MKCHVDMNFFVHGPEAFYLDPGQVESEEFGCLY